MLLKVDSRRDRDLTGAQLKGAFSQLRPESNLALGSRKRKAITRRGPAGEFERRNPKTGVSAAPSSCLLVGRHFPRSFRNTNHANCSLSSLRAGERAVRGLVSLYE